MARHHETPPVLAKLWPTLAGRPNLNWFLTLTRRWSTAPTAIGLDWDSKVCRVQGRPAYCKNHAPRLERWLSRITDDEVCGYRVFTFVRNPWDRADSIARYFGLDVCEFARHHERLLTANGVLAEHALPLHRYAYLDGAQFADFVGRFERLQADFDALCDLLSLTRREPPHVNRSRRRNYQQHFDDETRASVADLYRRDVELFGYRFEV